MVHLSHPLALNTGHAEDRTGVDRFRILVEEGVRQGVDRAPLLYLDISEAGMDFARDHGLAFEKDMVLDYPGDMHPTAVRHCIIAWRIYLFLVENRLVPAESHHYGQSEEIGKRLLEKAEGLWREAGQ
ncbi:hypothetical protein HQ520_04555 [bacterium]|nr:hypothetical protein [bacterium]